MEKNEVIAFLCVGALVFTGCGVGEPAGESARSAETASSVEEEATVGNSSVAEASEPGSADDFDESTQEILQARIRHIYNGVLSQIVAARRLPDGELDASQLDDGFGEMRDNHFAITDIDGDGMEELIINYSNACMAGMETIIYGFNPTVGQLKRELTEFPALTFYDNGMIRAEASHNHTSGEFWPFTLYQYQAAGD